MQERGEIAFDNYEVLEGLHGQIVGGFNSDEIGDIVGMVATHDNLIMDIQVDNPLRLALIDADRIWVMHFR